MDDCEKLSFQPGLLFNFTSFFFFRPAIECVNTSASNNPTPSGNNQRSSSATRSSTSSVSHRHRDSSHRNALSASHRHSTPSLHTPRISSAHSQSSSSVSNSTSNNLSVTSSNNNNSNSEDNSTSESEFPRRRSTRRRNYLNRNQLHSALDLPEGYGRYSQFINIQSARNRQSVSNTTSSVFVPS